MKLAGLIILFLVCFCCENENKSKQNLTESERPELLPEPSKAEKEKYLKSLNLISLLENPIDLQAFKKSKSNRHSTTGISKEMEYHFKPGIKDSIFYTYNYPSENFSDSKRIDQIVVFKYGKNKHKYNDETEILIELRIYNKNSDLGKANLVGVSKMELESDFGTEYLDLENRIAYSYKNKILILELENSKVKSFNYIKLNTENINRDLIGQIIK